MRRYHLLLAALLLLTLVLLLGLLFTWSPYFCPMPGMWSFSYVFAVLVTLALVAVLLLAVAPTSAKTCSEGDVELIMNLLPDTERSVLKYLAEKGGEATQASIAKALGLSKVRAWRTVQRLRAKGLVETRKVKGRVVVSINKDLLPRFRESSE